MSPEKRQWLASPVRIVVKWPLMKSPACNEALDVLASEEAMDELSCGQRLDVLVFEEALGLIYRRSRSQTHRHSERATNHKREVLLPLSILLDGMCLYTIPSVVHSPSSPKLILFSLISLL